MSEQLRDKWMESGKQINEKSDEKKPKNIDSKRYNRFITIKINLYLIFINFYDYSLQMNVYPNDSMDRFGDDLTELILSFLWFEDKIRLECVSKQWKRCVFQRQFVIAIEFFRGMKYQNTLNGLFRRSDDERQSDEQRLVSVMKKCMDITKVSLGRKNEDEVIAMMDYFYPLSINNVNDLFDMDLNVLLSP